MRMYGRENNEVVRPTNAVSVTRNTLKASIKNCSCPTDKLPCATTLAVRAHAAKNVTSEKTTLASGAQRRPPNITSVRAPSSGVPRRTMNSTLLVLLQSLEVLQVQAVKLFPNLKEKHAEHQHRHQHIERNPQLNHHRHAVSGAHRAEKQSIFHRQESDHFRHCFSARDHGEESNENHCPGDAEDIACSRARQCRNRLGQPE